MSSGCTQSTAGGAFVARPTHTLPAPRCSAARPARIAAPTMPSLPPTIASVPKLPLWTFCTFAQQRSAAELRRHGLPRQALALRGYDGLHVEIERMDADRAAMIGAVGGKQPGFERNECRRCGRADRRAVRDSGFRVEPARHVEREDRSWQRSWRGLSIARIRSSMRRVKPMPNRPSTIKPQRSSSRHSADRRPACGDPIAMGGSSVASPALRHRREMRRRHRKTMILSQRATTKASPPLLPGPASTSTRDGRPAEKFACDFRRRESGTLHQGLLRRTGFERPHLGEAINGVVQHVAIIGPGQGRWRSLQPRVGVGHSAGQSIHCCALAGAPAPAC